jgi:hypothetical protein
VTDYEGSLKTSLSLLDLMGPFLSPEILEREESITNLVIHLDESLGLLLLDQILWELLHWSRDSVEEMSRPSDATRDSWQVSDNQRIVFVLLILLLDITDLFSIVMEQDGVLGVEAISEVFSMEDRFELSQELQGVLDAGDNFKVSINVVLEISLD